MTEQEVAPGVPELADYQALWPSLATLGAADWAAALQQCLPQLFADSAHGDLASWRRALASLPSLRPSSLDLRERVRLGVADDATPEQAAQLHQSLWRLRPWRKGPFELFGLKIDSEWRSDWKWRRLQAHIAPLQYRRVLDVGCGNGYHCWRMLGAGAQLVVGIDPTLLSVMQHHALKRLYGPAPLYVLPVGIENVPPNLGCFDSVFSMGVMYHRRSPLDHLAELKGCLRPGGELVLETLVVSGGAERVLMPAGRYAQMRNVWFIPSCEMLMLWLRRLGFVNVRLIDVNQTSTDEQRSTDWMPYHSLCDFLDPADASLTREGLPAPLRAIVLAERAQD